MNNGAGMSGHTHPALVEAIQDQAEQGTLYTKPSELLVEAAEAITERWDAVDTVRFTNSGTESTMHAIRVARAHSGRDKILKIEGSYHGVHDYALISKSAPREKLGHPKHPRKVIESDGVPDAVADTVEVGPWNDIDAIEDILQEQVREIGAIIVEPIVMNVGVTQPYGEFLGGLRELCDEYGLVYIFDEVKTGVKVAPGGAAELYGVDPDLVAMAKSIGGNVPVGAFGGDDAVMAEITDGAAHFGTYNANPLALRAVITQLREVLTGDAYDHVDALGERLARGYEDVLADHGIAGHVDWGQLPGDDQLLRGARPRLPRLPRERRRGLPRELLVRDAQPGRARPPPPPVPAVDDQRPAHPRARRRAPGDVQGGGTTAGAKAVT